MQQKSIIGCGVQSAQAMKRPACSSSIVNSGSCGTVAAVCYTTTTFISYNLSANTLMDSDYEYMHQQSTYNTQYLHISMCWYNAPTQKTERENEWWAHAARRQYLAPCYKFPACAPLSLSLSFSLPYFRPYFFASVWCGVCESECFWDSDPKNYHHKHKPKFSTQIHCPDYFRSDYHIIM